MCHRPRRQRPSHIETELELLLQTIGKLKKISAKQLKEQIPSHTICWIKDRDLVEAIISENYWAFNNVDLSDEEDADIIHNFTEERDLEETFECICGQEIKFKNTEYEVKRVVDNLTKEIKNKIVGSTSYFKDRIQCPSCRRWHQHHCYQDIEDMKQRKIRDRR